MIRSLIMFGSTALLAVAATAQPAQDPPAATAPPASSYGARSDQGWPAPTKTAARHPASQQELDALAKSGRHGRHGNRASGSQPRGERAAGTTAQAGSAKRATRMERRQQRSAKPSRQGRGGHQGGRHRGRGQQIGPSYGSGV